MLSRGRVGPSMVLGVNLVFLLSGYFGSLVMTERERRYLVWGKVVGSGIGTGALQLSLFVIDAKTNTIMVHFDGFVLSNSFLFL